MARGKKTSPEVVYQVMTSWSITNNYNQTARDLGMAFATVKDIVERNKDKEEFVKLQDEKRATFVEKADEIIDILLDRIIKEATDEEREIPFNQLTTALGTVYDKRALAKGESTQNVDFATNFNVAKLAEIAGYSKKGDDQ